MQSAPTAILKGRERCSARLGSQLTVHALERRLQRQISLQRRRLEWPHQYAGARVRFSEVDVETREPDIVLPENAQCGREEGRDVILLSENRKLVVAGQNRGRRRRSRSHIGRLRSCTRL